MSKEDAKPATTDDEILEEARTRYALCVDAESENRERALADLRFLSGDQWDDKDKTRRSIEGRPCLTINKLPTFLHQVTNDQRQNKPGIKVHPVDDDADEETAEVEQGLIRHIEYASNADVAYDRAVNSAAAIGFGYFQLTTDYVSPKSFDQEIRFKSIRNALSVKIDPLSTEPDGSDMQFAFIESQMARSEFEAKYPKAQANNKTLFSSGTSYQQWLTENTVLVCEYYRIERTPAKVVLLSNGESGYKDDMAVLPPGVTVKNERDSYRQKVMWYKLTGVDILEKTEIKCDWIPLFPVYGDEIDIEGKVVRSGLVRYAKDPAQMYNYWMTSATEEVAMRNKTPYIGAEGQFEGYEGDWQNANNETFSYLQYKPVTIDGNLAPAPQRQPMADVPSGVLAMALHASDNIKATTGLFDSSLGARSNANSGKQEIAQQRQGDMANFHYTDNLNRTVKHAGRCILSMIPNYYDSERVVRILGADDTASHVKINAPIPPEQQQPDEETGAIKKVLNDLTVGQYDVTVSSGPSYDTMRQEAVDGMIQAGQSWPQLWQIAGDKMIAAMDWPGAEEIADRIKKTLPPGIAEDDDQAQEPLIQTHKGPLPASQAGQAIDMLSQQLEQAHAMLQKAEIDKQQIQMQELAIKDAEAKTKQFAAETDRVSADADLIRAQAEAAGTSANVQQIVQAATAEAIQRLLDSPAHEVHAALEAIPQ